MVGQRENQDIKLVKRRRVFHEEAFKTRNRCRLMGMGRA
jgi:hypothetical protein